MFLLEFQQMESTVSDIIQHPKGWERDNTIAKQQAAQVKNSNQGY